MQIHIGWIIGSLVVVGGAVYLYTQSQQKQLAATTGLEGVDSTVGQSRQDVVEGLKFGQSLANTAGEIAKAFAAGARSSSQSTPQQTAATQPVVSARSSSTPTSKAPSKSK